MPVSFRRVSPKVCLAVGQTAYACVYANTLWNDSGLDVLCGQSYNFSVPNGERWFAGRRLSGADGYTSGRLDRILGFARRVPKANWLQLIGTIGRSTYEPILIGSRLTSFAPESDGRLYFFANTLSCMHWSNSGMIAVRVKRTS